MARPAVEVRDAGVGDLDVLMELYASARFDQGPLRTPAATVRARLARALEHDEVQVLLAFLGAEPAGYALLTTFPLLPLSGSAGPSIEHLHVVPGLRRRGVGRALLRRALVVAQAGGAEQIACTVLPGDRDYTRYMARLGFAPAVVRRAVPVPVLRRRLADGPPALLHTTDVVARRRSLRARLARSAVPAPGNPPTGVPTAS